MKDILDLLYTLEYMPFKNKERMLQAYKTLIGSRIYLGIEIEFIGTISSETARKFVTLIEKHSLYRKYVVTHNMGHDGVSYTDDEHSYGRNGEDREYRIQFNVKIGWGWCHLLEYILMLCSTLNMPVGSIHVHYNSRGEYDRYTKKRSGKPPLLTTNKITTALEKNSNKLYGIEDFHTRRFRYKESRDTQTLEIRVITPTVFYQQLLFEILYREQVTKELQDGYRRTL